MARSKARKLADILSGGSTLEDGVVSASEVVGLGTAATTAATDYATAAQGTLAASALQPTGDGSQLTGISSSVATLTDATVSTTDPAVNSNPTSGTGHVWINKTSGEQYVLTDATADNNVWYNVGDGGGAIQPVQEHLIVSQANESNTNVDISGTYTVPAGPNTITLFGVAGGGSSAFGKDNDHGSSGGGGGAANISGFTASVTSGDVITYQIGAGGSTPSDPGGALPNPPRSLSGVAGGETWVKKNGAYILRLGGGAGPSSGTSGSDHSASAAGGTVLTGTGVAGGAGGRGAIRNSNVADTASNVTNAPTGGGGGGAHVSQKGGGNGGTITVNVSSATVGSNTISFAGSSAGTAGTAASSGDSRPSTNTFHAVGGFNVAQDSNAGAGGGAGSGIKPTVNGSAYTLFYGGGGGGNRGNTNAQTTETVDGTARNSGSGGGGFLIAIVTAE
jgi:hypothetical protein